MDLSLPNSDMKIIQMFAYNFRWLLTGRKPTLGAQAWTHSQELWRMLHCYTMEDAPRTSSGPMKTQVFGKKSGPFLFPWWYLGQFHANLRWNYKEVRINHKWENIINCFSPTSSQAHRLLITIIWTLGVKEVSDVRVPVTSHGGPAECPWVSAVRVGIWILESEPTEGLWLMSGTDLTNDPGWVAEEEIRTLAIYIFKRSLMWLIELQEIIT